jgi:ParD-like antitoxin of type II bacterial toxin-antitoxin system
MPSLAIKISADLAAAARAAAEAAERSLTAQIEHWARMGKKLDEQVTGGAMMAFKRSEGGSGTMEEPAHRMEIEAVLAQLRQPGFATQAALASGFLMGRTTYGGDPNEPGVILRYEANGTETRGRMVDGVFCPFPPEAGILSDHLLIYRQSSEINLIQPSRRCA